METATLAPPIERTPEEERLWIVDKIQNKDYRAAYTEQYARVIARIAVQQP